MSNFIANKIKLAKRSFVSALRSARGGGAVTLKFVPVVRVALALLLTISIATFGAYMANAQSASDSGDTSYKEFLKKLANDDGSGKKTFSARGIFNCEGAVYARVGLPGPSGPFVPVFDQAVHSQVSLLAYKECILDKIATHNANAVLAGLANTYIKQVNDQDLIVRDYTEYLKKERVKSVKDFLKKCKSKLSNLGTEGEAICARVAQQRVREITSPYDALNCSVPEETRKAFLENKDVSFTDMIDILSQPGCTPLNARIAAEGLALQEEQERVSKTEYEIQSGFKPAKKEITRKELDLDKSRPGALVFKDVTAEEVVTPGTIVAGQLNLVLGTGIRKVESVDEIDEMVQTFLANLSNRALDATNYGVYGMSRSINGTKSYIDSLADQERAVAGQFRAYAGGASLGTMIENEKAFLAYKQDTVKYILNAIHDLRSYENACFEEKILPGAKEAVTQDAIDASCNLWVAPGGASSTCPATASVSEEILSDFLDVYESQSGNTIEHGKLVISGKSGANGSASLDFINQENKATSTTVNVSSNWQTEIDTDQIPEGELTVKIRYPNSTERENEFYKKTTAGIPVIVLPEDRYRIKLTAKSSGMGITSQEKTVTLLKNRVHSQVYTGRSGSLTSTLQQVLKQIEDTQFTLEILYKIAAEAKDNPELANWKVDQLSSKNAIHTASQIRDAKDAAASAASQMPDFVQGIVKDEWEANGAGWCNKDKWEDFKVE